jgi:hypothetical protein
LFSNCEKHFPSSPQPSFSYLITIGSTGSKYPRPFYP